MAGGRPFLPTFLIPVQGAGASVAELSNRIGAQYGTSYVNEACVSGIGVCGLEELPGYTPPVGLPWALPGQGKPAGPGAAQPQAPRQPQVDIYTVVSQAVTDVQLPEPTIHLGPEPSQNEWNMLAVGLPVWFWTDGPGQIDNSVTQQGITVQLVATPGPTVISTGDGTTVTCTTSEARPDSADPMDESPSCGHTWTTAGTHEVTATTTWNVAWSVLGQSGVVQMPREATRSVEVGELVSVVTR